MNIVDIKNPQWANVENTMIDLQIKFEGESEYFPYTAMVCDEEMPTDLFHRAQNNEFGPVASMDTARQEGVIKDKRNKLLDASDWTQMPDVPQETKEKWATYRQALRDITEQEGYPFDVTFPEKPE